MNHRHLLNTSVIQLSLFPAIVPSCYVKLPVNLEQKAMHDKDWEAIRRYHTVTALLQYKMAIGKYTVTDLRFERRQAEFRISVKAVSSTRAVIAFISSRSLTDCFGDFADAIRTNSLRWYTDKYTTSRRFTNHQ